jgi:hypothetical protein
MKKKTPEKPSVIAKIQAAVSAARLAGYTPWYSRLPARHRKTVQEIHLAWHAGEFGSRRSTAAKAISEILATLGIEIGRSGVEAWLRKRPDQL